MATRTVNVSLDNWYLSQGGGFDFGNGKGAYFASGRGTGSYANLDTQFGLAFPRGSFFNGVSSATAITAFNVKIRVADQCMGIGNAVKFVLAKANTPVVESSFGSGDNCNGSMSGPSSGKVAPTVTSTNQAEWEGTPSGGDWLTIPMLAMGRQWFTAGWSQLDLVGFPSNGSGAPEFISSRRCTFHSRHAGSAPYIEMVYSLNQAPNIPTDLSLVSTAGTQATVSSRHTDPEANNASQYQAQWYPSSATDATPGAFTKDSTVSVTTAHNALRSHTFTGLPARTAGKWRMRFYDGQWGPWSLLQAATTAYKPTAVNLAVQPGTLTPLLYASIQSSDPSDFITAVEEFIYQDPAVGQTITKWASGKQSIGGSPTRSEIAYGGSALSYGTPYRRRVIIYNRDDVPSDLTANFAFTQLEPTGPVIKIGSSAGPVASVDTKIDDLTATFNLSDAGAANIDQLRFWVKSKAGALLHDSGVVSFTSGADEDYTLPSGVLAYGMDNPTIEAAVRVTGNANIGPTTEPIELHVNAVPGSPYPVSVSGGLTVLRSDLVWVTTDSTPALLLPFRDVDLDLGYTETMERQEVEIRDDAEAAFGASPYIDATSPSETFTSPTLTAEETYDFRARVDDSASSRSEWSERVYVKYSAAPTLTSVTPADTDIITDPTPVFEGTYGHSGGVAEVFRELTLRDGETIIYASGLQVPGDIEVPPDTLPNATDLDYELTAYNEDGLWVTVTGTITTDFTQPAALTGLVITQDTDAKALLVEWDESSLTTDEFQAYLLYAKTEGGQFELVATFTDKASVTTYYRAAAHNRETIIRLTQTNGWMESEPIEASETLVVDNDWVLTSSTVVQLLDAKGAPEHQPVIREEITALGREDDLVLNWGATGFRGSMTAYFTSLAELEQFQQWCRDGTVVLFKFADGRVRYAKPGIGDSVNVVESLYEASVNYIQVSSEGVGF